MDVSDFFISLIEEFRNVREAEKEFRRQISDDPALEAEYEAWCAKNDYEPRTALREFGEEYIEARESRWNSLNDYDDIQ